MRRYLIGLPVIGAFPLLLHGCAPILALRVLVLLGGILLTTAAGELGVHLIDSLFNNSTIENSDDVATVDANNPLRGRANQVITLSISKEDASVDCTPQMRSEDCVDFNIVGAELVRSSVNDRWRLDPDQRQRVTAQLEAAADELDNPGRRL